MFSFALGIDLRGPKDISKLQNVGPPNFQSWDSSKLGYFPTFKTSKLWRKLIFATKGREGEREREGGRGRGGGETRERREWGERERERERE